MLLTRKLLWLLSCLIAFFSCKKSNENCIDCQPAAAQVSQRAAFEPGNIQNLYFRGIRPDDPDGSEPLDNPERGFRFEFIMKAADLKNPYIGIDYSAMGPALQSEEMHFGNEKVRLAQVYFYLTDFLKKKISVVAMRNMQQVFDQLKKNGFKVVLRFAYRYDDNSPYETLSDISTHIAQLHELLVKNEAVIYVVQAGFLGLWGEWHHSVLDNDQMAKTAVLRKLLANIPASRKLQVREPAFKTAMAGVSSGYVNENGNHTLVSYSTLPAAEFDRIGFHNDYFVLDQGLNAAWDYRCPDPDFYQVKKEGQYSVVDGEMPYEFDFQSIAWGAESGWYAANRMREHSYSSFSIIHNYNTNLKAWKSTWLNATRLKNAHIAVTADYFIDQSGREVSRNAFEYIRDHLGYRLQLTAGRIPQRTAIGATAHVECTLANFGFSRMINKRPVYIVLIDSASHVREILTKANPLDWYPSYDQNERTYTIMQDITTDDSYIPGKYKVGLWMPDPSTALKYDPRYAVKMANGNIQWWKDGQNRYMVNIIGSFELY